MIGPYLFPLSLLELFKFIHFWRGCLSLICSQSENFYRRIYSRAPKNRQRQFSSISNDTKTLWWIDLRQVGMNKPYVKSLYFLNSQAGESPDLVTRSVFQRSGLHLDRLPKTAKKYPLLYWILHFLKRFGKTEIQLFWRMNSVKNFHSNYSFYGFYLILNLR